MPKAQPLEYQAAEPAFLRRLKANNLALDGRHNVQIPRARGGMGVNDRLNMKGEDGDDEPIVVDEEGNVVSREEVERMEGGKGGGDAEGKVDDGTDEQEKRGQREGLVKRHDEDAKVTSRFGKKRKAVKIVAEEAKDDVNEKGNDFETDEQVKSLKESTKDLKSVVAQGKEDAKKEETGKKSKRKKIKLSFDEPE